MKKLIEKTIIKNFHDQEIMRKTKTSHTNVDEILSETVTELRSCDICTRPLEKLADFKGYCSTCKRCGCAFCISSSCMACQAQICDDCKIGFLVGERPLSVCPDCVAEVNRFLEYSQEVNRIRQMQEQQKLDLAHRKLELDVAKIKLDGWLKMLQLIQKDDGGVIDIMQKIIELNSTNKMLQDLDRLR